MARKVLAVRGITSSVMFIVLAACGCSSRQGPSIREGDVPTETARGTMKLTSSAFDDGMKIGIQYTTEGEDVSPPLTWNGVPDATKSLALICDDPDAPSPARPGPEPWVHWILFNIPAEVSELPEGIERSKSPVQVPGASQGVNSWPQDNIGYRGPTPPPGSGTHRYVFTLYALDVPLQLPAGTSKSQLLRAMSGHVLAEGKLIGTYQR